MSIWVIFYFLSIGLVEDNPPVLTAAKDNSLREVDSVTADIDADLREKGVQSTEVIDTSNKPDQGLVKVRSKHLHIVG